MPLSPGTTLGPYAVTAKIGEGGMGEVYRARDTKLDRDVALKVLPQAFTDDPDRLARFEREAKVLASLNHPNIGGIHGLEESDGIRALVLEYIEGPTLADRIAQGPIPVDEALPIAKQIAEALEAAHEAGVIHRDLKPANIKLKPDGTVKVLDFGLAKALDPLPDGDPSQSPTLTAAATQMGVIIGTAAYMAPEQGKGKAVDRRADIWAFGCVFYEMLSGQRSFAGETISETLADVMKTEPAWNRLPADLPSKLTNLIRRCLTKEPRQRMRDIGDVRLAMEGAFETTVTAPSAPVVPQLQVWQRPIPAAVFVLAVAAIAALAAWALMPVSRQPVARFAASVPPSAAVALSNDQNDVAISPDGSRVIYQAADNMLHVRTLDQLEGAPLRGTEGAENPFLSPDGAWVGFHDDADDALKKVSILGGPPVTICSIFGRASRRELGAGRRHYLWHVGR